jgi:hypothetical protein
LRKGWSWRLDNLMKSRRTANKVDQHDVDRDQFDRWCDQWESKKGLFDEAPKTHVPTPQYAPEDFFGNYNPAGESDIRDVDAEYWNRVHGASRTMQAAPDVHKMFDDEGAEYEWVPDATEVLTENADVEAVEEVSKDELARMRAANLTQEKNLGRINSTLAEWVDARREWMSTVHSTRKLIHRTLPKDWNLQCESVDEALDDHARRLTQKVYELSRAVPQCSSPFVAQGYACDRYPLERWVDEAKQFREAASILKLASAKSAKEWGLSLNEAKAKKTKELFTPIDTEEYENDLATRKAMAEKMIRSVNPIEYPSQGKDQRPHVTPWSGGKQLAEVEKVKRELEKLEVKAHTLFGKGRMSEGKAALKNLESLQKKLDELSDLLSPDQTSDYQS